MADEPGIGEVARKIEDFRLDVRDDFAALKERLNDFVLREVYRVERQAMADRIERLENNEASNRRWRLGLLTATLAAVTGAVATVVLEVLTHGGGH